MKDPTNSIKTKITNITNKLHKQQKISTQTKYELVSIEELARIRGQPKLHKPEHPMRIITSIRYTITTPISKLIYSIIKPLRETIQNTINNTNNFIRQISHITLEENEALASLDIEDLYNNIPITRSIDIAINRIENIKTFQESPFTKTDIKQMLMLALNNSYSKFNGTYYRQKRGLPMGSNLSPILADLYMDEYMNKNMKEVNKQHKIWRYVDDILIITKMNENERIHKQIKQNKRKHKIHL